MATAAQAIAMAKSQIGQSENPKGSNRTKFTAWYGMVGAWCAMGQSWVQAQLGNPTIHFAWCNSGRQSFQNGSYGTWIPAGNTPRPGDLCFWSDGSPNLAHVSMVDDGVQGPDTFNTIDFNWGDTVQIVSRANHHGYKVAGFGRPYYTTAPTQASPAPRMPVPSGDPLLRRRPRMSTGTDVVRLQAALNHVSGIGLQVDGKYGKMTEGAVVAMQHMFSLVNDGIYGPESAKVLRYAVAMK